MILVTGQAYVSVENGILTSSSASRARGLDRPGKVRQSLAATSWSIVLSFWTASYRRCVGKPAGTKNVTEAGRERIRALFRQGVKVADIVRRTKRSDTVIYRATRGVKRRRLPRRQSTLVERDDAVVRMVGRAHTHREVARVFEISTRRVGQILERSPGIARLLRDKNWKPAQVAKLCRSDRSEPRRLAMSRLGREPLGMVVFVPQRPECTRATPKISHVEVSAAQAERRGCS